MCNMEHETKTTPAVEEWRPVKGYEGLYEVSDLARVRSLDRVYTQKHSDGHIAQHLYKGSIRKPKIGCNGYMFVNLYKNNICQTKSIHRLVAEAFVPNPDNLQEVNHKDENKANNLPSNLEWCDRSYNCKYGQRADKYREKVSKPFEQLTLDGVRVRTFRCLPDIVEAGFKMSQMRNIHNVLNKKGKNKTAYGYQWRYI